MNSPPECPACSKALMSRMSKRCNWCGAELPESLRFTEEEINQIKTEENASRAELEANREEHQKKEQKKTIIRGAVDLASHGIFGILPKE
jgi:CHAT domain-containing protein